MARPWEQLASSAARPWEQSSPMYPRVISIKRPNAPASMTPGYQGLSRATETVMADDLPASIVMASTGRAKAAGDLPSSAPGPIVWRIIIPTASRPPNVAVDDLVYDDLGRRFKVDGAEPEPLALLLSSIQLLP